MFQTILQYIPLIAATLAIMSCVATFFIQIGRRFDKKFDSLEKRMDGHDQRFEMLEERIFQLAMGKTLEEAMRADAKRVKG